MGTFTPMALLELDDLHFAYRDREVVRGVTLSLRAGEVVAIVGPSGAGKSTLLRLASGLLAPSGGTVRLDGASLADLDRRRAAQRIAGVTPEQRAELPFTVRESIAFGRHPWRSRFAALSPAEETAIDEAVRDTDLGPLAGRPLTELSSGERQRAAIARCLVQDAALWLLDEPTAHLDLGHRLRVLDLVRRAVRERDRGALVVMHDLNLAALAADRIGLLIDGRLEALDAPAAVLTVEAIERGFGARVHVAPHPERGVPVISALGPARRAP